MILTTRRTVESTVGRVRFTRITHHGIWIVLLATFGMAVPLLAYTLSALRSAGALSGLGKFSSLFGFAQTYHAAWVSRSSGSRTIVRRAFVC